VSSDVVNYFTCNDISAVFCNILVGGHLALWTPYELSGLTFVGVRFPESLPNSLTRQ
jgi:hypothetical protein